MKSIVLCFSLLFTLAAAPSGPDYTIRAIRYGTIPGFPISELMVGAPETEKIDIPLMFWLIQGGGRNILLDTGFHRKVWFERFRITDYVRPDEALRAAGLQPEDIDDIVLSHMHWDHAGGVDLFPQAVVWIQKGEYEYYLGPAWQKGGQHGGIDREDVLCLLSRNTEGKLRLIDGDDREILPGIRAYTGGRHTYASQYLLIQGDPPFVLASDNCYLFRNLETHTAIPTFSPADRSSSLAALDRMATLAGSPDRVIPGHDPEVFKRFPTLVQQSGTVTAVGGEGQEVRTSTTATARVTIARIK